MVVRVVRVVRVSQVVQVVQVVLVVQVVKVVSLNDMPSKNIWFLAVQDSSIGDIVTE